MEGLGDQLRVLVQRIHMREDRVHRLYRARSVVRPASNALPALELRLCGVVLTVDVRGR